MLPLFLQIAIDRLVSDSSLRRASALDELIDSYAATYGMPVADADRARAHAEAGRRFHDFQASTNAAL
jgi:hypothetical protein